MNRSLIEIYRSEALNAVNNVLEEFMFEPASQESLDSIKQRLQRLDTKEGIVVIKELDVRYDRDVNLEGNVGVKSPSVAVSGFLVHEEDNLRLGHFGFLMSAKETQ